MFTANVSSPWGHFGISSYCRNWKPTSMSTIPRIDILNSAFSFPVIKVQKFILLIGVDKQTLNSENTNKTSQKCTEDITESSINYKNGIMIAKKLF